MGSHRPLGLVLPTPPATIMARLAPLDTQTTSIGPLVLATQVDASRAQALITATLAGTRILRRLLTMAAPTFQLDGTNGTASVAGTITMTMAQPPQYSDVGAKLVVANGAARLPFDGEIASWIATDAPVVAERDFLISAVLTAHTTVRGLAGTVAELAFISGAATLACETATQVSPVQVFPEVAAGAVYIAAGATINLTVPTALQQGSLFLQASFPKQPAGSNKISSAVAFWPQPP